MIAGAGRRTRRALRRQAQRALDRERGRLGGVEGADRPRRHRSASRRPRQRSQQTTDDLPQLEQEIVDEVTAIDEKWKAVAENVETVSIRLEATDVRVTDVRLVWVPVD